jgi:GTP-dependent dephospho-CoA kinase
MDLVLTENQRANLKKPFGKLYPDIDSITPLVAGKKVIAIGDKVTDGAIMLGITPQVCVYDGRTKRRKIAVPDSIIKYDARAVSVNNPAGQITDEAFQALKEAFSTAARTKIFVSGEEDLLTIAAISLAPAGSYVIYGQPDEGVVLVEVNTKTKDLVEKILAEMIRK